MGIDGRRLLMAAIVWGLFQMILVCVLIIVLFGLLDISLEGKESILSFFCVWMGVGSAMHLILRAGR